MAQPRGGQFGQTSRWDAPQPLVEHDLLRRLDAAEAEIRRLRRMATEAAIESERPFGAEIRRLPSRSRVVRATFESAFDPSEGEALDPPEPSEFLLDDGAEVETPIEATSPSTVLDDSFENVRRPSDIGINFYTGGDFGEGIILRGTNAAMKVSGYVKADFIQDLDPIDSTDVFDTTSIPVGAEPRENARFHARQSRLNFDTRWASDFGTVRVFVEGDFLHGGWFSGCRPCR